MEKLKSIYQNQKQNINYWLVFLGVIDLALISQEVFKYLQSGRCRNYMLLAGDPGACTVFEFARNGLAWLSFSHLFVFLPAAVIMILATNVVDAVFVKKD